MRISVTDLDQYRYYMGSETMVLEDLLARLRHEQPPNLPMKIGSAFHTILELAETEDDILGEQEDVDGTRIFFSIKPELHLEIPAIRELKGEIELEALDGTPVTLVGKVDAMEGKRVWDHKLTSRANLDNYLDAVQWRAYLLIFGADQFTYNLFTYKLVAESDAVARVEIVGLEHFDFWSYNRLREDVIEAVSDFVAFCRIHLPERLAA